MGFEVRLERKLMSTQVEEQDGIEPYGLRVGWSAANTSLLLGKDVGSLLGLFHVFYRRGRSYFNRGTFSVFAIFFELFKLLFSHLSPFR